MLLGSPAVLEHLEEHVCENRKISGWHCWLAGGDSSPTL